MTEAGENPFVGVWKLISCEAIRRNGEVVALYGSHPMGRLYYDAAGNMSVHIMRGDRKRLACDRKGPMNSSEIRAAYEGYQAYFSTYVVEAQYHRIHHHVLGSLSPDWIGTTQTRSYEFQGTKRLVLSSGSDGKGGSGRTRVRLVWERLDAACPSRAQPVPIPQRP